MPAMRIFYSHGGRGNEGRTYVDGLSTGSAFNGGGASGYIIDTANSQEMQLTLSGGLGETEDRRHHRQLHPEDRRQHASRARASSAPPASGRRATTSTTGSAPWASARQPRSTRTGTCRPRSAVRSSRDKLWFFGNYRDFGSHDDILGMYGNLNAGNANAWTYVAGSEPQGAQRRVAHGHGAPPDGAGDAAQQGRLLLRQPARVRRLDDERPRQDGCRPRGDDWVASGTDDHRARSGQRRAGHRGRRIRLRRLMAARHAGDLDARRPPAGCCSKPASRPTSASGDGWSSRARF